MYFSISCCSLILKGEHIHIKTIFRKGSTSRYTICRQRSDLCFCRRICSRAFISTLSKYVAAVTQCFTLPFIGNSGGNNEPRKIESIDSGLHQIKQPNGRSHRLTLHYTNNTITVGLSPTAFQKEGDKKSFHLNKKK